MERRTDGPRPDVWSPSSSSWPGLLSDALRTQDRPTLVPEGELPSLVRTPLVIAMPKSMAEVLGWPAKQPGWSDLLTLTGSDAGPEERQQIAEASTGASYDARKETGIEKVLSDVISKF